MSGLVLLIAVVMIGIVLIWSIVNDSVPTEGRTRWLLAMRDAEDAIDGEGSPTRNGDEAAPKGRSVNPGEPSLRALTRPTEDF